jgi:hypothetical protein
MTTWVVDGALFLYALVMGVSVYLWQQRRDGDDQ